LHTELNGECDPIEWGRNAILRRIDRHMASHSITGRNSTVTTHYPAFGPASNELFMLPVFPVAIAADPKCQGNRISIIATLRI
jgi:hypothetical protein